MRNISVTTSSRSTTNRQGTVQSPINPQEIVQIPFGPGTQLLDDILMASTPQRLAQMMSRKCSQLGYAMELQCDSDALETAATACIVSKKNGNTVRVHIDSLDALKQGKQSARKIFDFLRMKLNQGTIIDGKIIRKECVFPLSDLVEAGLYSSVASARRGFNAAMQALLSLQIQVNLKYRKSAQEHEEALFTEAIVHNGICRITLNPNLNWKSLFAYYAPTPRWAFSLPYRAQALMLYLHEIARQHTDDVAAGRPIMVHLETLQYKLCLPDNMYGHGCRDIIGGLSRAIEAVEILQANLLSAEQQKSTSAADSTESLSMQLSGICFTFSSEEEPKTMREFASGKLSVTVSQSVQSELVNFHQNKVKKRKAYAQRKKRREDSINREIAKRVANKKSSAESQRMQN